MAKTKVANDNHSTVVSKVIGWFEYSSAVAALNRLDDQALQQIGIKRSGIQKFVKSWNDNHTTDAA